MAKIAYPSQSVARLAIAIAVVSLLTALWALFHPSRGVVDSGVGGSETALQRINRQGLIRAGFGGFPPYTIIDLNEPDPSKRVRGFVVDVVNEIASRHDPKLKVEWYKLNWETLRADMLSGKFDVLADGVFETVPLASDFGLSDPFSYFGMGCAVVRKDDDRFKTFEDLERSDITIAVAVGWVTTDYAKKHLHKPKFKDVVVADSPNLQFDEVVAGRADVALQDVPTVLSYVRAHHDQVKALWVENPPAVVAGGFVVRREDRDLLDFINSSLRILEADGTMKRLDQTWSGMGYYPKVEYIPGAGLSGIKPPTNQK